VDRRQRRPVAARCPNHFRDEVARIAFKAPVRTGRDRWGVPPQFLDQLADVPRPEHVQPLDLALPPD
jgi:hypothetical protein